MSLVLERRPGEAIQIGDVRLTVLSISGKRVKFALDAPREIVIRRPEVAARTWPPPDVEPR